MGGVGITINQYDLVTILPAEGKRCYEMGLTRDGDEIYETDNLEVSAIDIHSVTKSRKAKVLDNWSGFLNVANRDSFDVGSATFAVGDMVDGDLNLGGVEERDIEFFKRTLKRIRMVGNAALNGPDSEDVVQRS
jgi:hypothetical protein